MAFVVTELSCILMLCGLLTASLKLINHQFSSVQYPMLKKRLMICFDRLSACDGQMDGHPATAMETYG